MSAEDQTPDVLDGQVESRSTNSIQEKIAKMACLYARPAGCADCTGAKMAASDKAESIAQRGISIKEGVKEYVAVFNEERCQGMQTNENKQFCKDPDFICTHKLGAQAVRTIFAKGNSL